MDNIPLHEPLSPIEESSLEQAEFTSELSKSFADDRFMMSLNSMRDRLKLEPITTVLEETEDKVKKKKKKKRRDREGSHSRMRKQDTAVTQQGLKNNTIMAADVTYLTPGHGIDNHISNGLISHSVKQRAMSVTSDAANSITCNVALPTDKGTDTENTRSPENGSDNQAYSREMSDIAGSMEGKSPDVENQDGNNLLSASGKKPASSGDSPSKWKSVRTAVRITNHYSRRSQHSVDSFMEKFNTNKRGPTQLNIVNEPDELDQDENFIEVKGRQLRNKCATNCPSKLPVLKPDGSLLFYWMLIVSIAVEYNLWIQILRQAFHTIQTSTPGAWFALDAVADIIYILDILVQLRTGYLEGGVLVTNNSDLTRHYVKSKYFIIDLLTLLPLDFLYIGLGVHPLLRFPRFLKIYRLVQTLRLAENQSNFPNVLRVSHLIHILLLLCHWFAAFYFMISKSEKGVGTWAYPINNNETVYETVTRQYLASLYWSTLTLTTIGDLPAPESNWQYCFQIVSYLIGVFVFATVVGQVGNAINNYTATRHQYEQLLDGAKLYMRKHEVPQEMRFRVQKWCDYAWTRGRMQGAGDLNSLKMLPNRLKSELALHVHLDILKQVNLFEDCEPEFLHDLVLKMTSYIYTPGDMVVRKGEIAREMFIIAEGHLEVLGDDSRFIAHLDKGNFFGEIGILNLDGGINRRTADVRSVGYTELFVLERDDIMKAIKYYPSAKASLMRHAKLRLAEMRAQHPNNKSRTTPPLIVNDGESLSKSGGDDIEMTLLETPRLGLDKSLSQSTYSLRSMDDNEMMKIRENELIEKLNTESREKDKLIKQLTNQVDELTGQLKKLQINRKVQSKRKPNT